MEVPWNPLKCHNRMEEIMFETFRTPATHIASQPVLSLQASGRTTGVILDCGDGITYCAPIYEGQCVQHSVTQLHFGGRGITNFLVKLLAELQYNFESNTGRELIRDMKEQIAYVAFEPEKEIDCPSAQYKLPDGKVITLTKERYKCCEPLFKSNILRTEAGLHELIYQASGLLDFEIQQLFLANVVLAGGTTLLPGLAKRLEKELNLLADPMNTRIKIIAPIERKYSAWIGGSALASLAAFQHNWVSRVDYYEKGKSKKL